MAYKKVSHTIRSIISRALEGSRFDLFYKRGVQEGQLYLDQLKVLDFYLKDVHSCLEQLK